MLEGAQRSESRHRLLIPRGASVLVGRGRGCHLVLDDRRVSRIHARLWRQADEVWVQDLDALNGIGLDGHRLAGPAALRPGARLGIGRFELVLEWGADRPGRQVTSTRSTWLPIWIRSALPSSWLPRMRR